MLYVLSSGPALYLHYKGAVSADALTLLYKPLNVAYKHNAMVGSLLQSYWDLWRPEA
jgi:hypothetical protein